MPSTSDAPYWLQFVQPFGAVAIGAGAFLIAFLQWRTAHTKLRLDLFDRRLQAIDKIRELVSEAFQNYFDFRRNFRIERAISHARLLFGDDIKVYLDRLKYQIDRFLETSERDLMTTGRENKEREDIANEQRLIIESYISEFECLENALEPYFKIKVRRPTIKLFSIKRMSK